VPALPDPFPMRPTLRKARFRVRRALHKPLDRETLRRYWLDPPDAGNSPGAYLAEGEERSRYLVELLGRHARPNGSVLELGCNAGRNLNALYRAGWTDLTAIELSENALAALRKTFPDVAAESRLLAGALEDRLPELADNEFDVVFSMAVLEHVHYDSDWVLADAVRVCRGRLVTIENEQDVSDRTFPRDYRRSFESLGAIQIAEIERPPGSGAGFVARVFEV
jgi:SAM-dependent methyltransferase